MRSFAQGVRWKCGAYRYRVPRWVDQSIVDSVFNGKREYKLGKTQHEAALEYARIMRELEGPIRPIQTIGDLITRYRSEVIPQKADQTQRSNLISIARLHNVFGELQPLEFKSSFAFEYRDKRKDTPTSANRDLEVLSHLFSKAIEWGLIENSQHPIRDLRYKFTQPPRDRYVEDWEVSEALTVASPFLKAYISLKLALGLRKSDMLRLQLSDFRSDGIYTGHKKTATKTIYELNEARVLAWNQCLAVRPKRAKGSELLFCTRDALSYVKEDGQTSGFDSMWQRFMKKVLSETKVSSRFTEHDLRAKVASDSEDSEQARKRLGHQSMATTKKVYMRKAERAS